LLCPCGQTYTKNEPAAKFPDSALAIQPTFILRSLCTDVTEQGVVSVSKNELFDYRSSRKHDVDVNYNTPIWNCFVAI